MTQFPITDKPARMGRPPLAKDSMTKATLVRLTDEMLQHIDSLAGKNRRAEFIREAIEREIKRREKAKD